VAFSISGRACKIGSDKPGVENGSNGEEAMSIELAHEQLLAFQAKLNRLSARSWSGKERGVPNRLIDPDYCSSRLMVADLNGGLAVHYFGEDHEPWDATVKLLAKSDIVQHIVSLRIDGPDQGANGCREWRFDPVLKTKPVFENLRDFWIRPTATSDHNFSMVEDGQLSQLLALMPELVNLTAPQAPETDFFRTRFAHLRSIAIGMDWRTRGFIGELAKAETLPALTLLDFTDSLAPFLAKEPQDAEWDSTPFDDYVALLQSPIGAKLRMLRLRNTRLTEAQFVELQAVRPHLQFSVILDAPHCYVSHWNDSQFPHKHLLPFG
jgi:hypothetical protein